MGREISAAELVERADEFEQLCQVVTEAERGEGRLALVDGPAGMGKSSLLAAVAEKSAAQACSERDLRISTARATPAESKLAFGVILQLLAPIVSNDHGRTPLLSNGAIAPLFSNEALTREIESGSTAKSTLAVQHALFVLVERVCAEGPLVMLIDDAQWADLASLRALHYIAQRRSYLRLAMILAIRSGEPGAKSEPLAALRQDPTAIAISPAPLTARGVKEVVKRSLPEADSQFCRSISEATCGNPWYVKAMVRLVVDEGLDPTAEGLALLSGRTPPEIQRELTDRLSRIPESERRLAQAAAVLGDGAELRQAATVAGLDTEAACQAADSLLARDIFSGISPLVFSHPLVVDSIRADLGEAEQAYLQLLSARTLNDDHAPAQRVAIHLLDAFAGREEWVVEVLLKAAAEARARGATESAVNFLERALREGGGLERRAEILFQLGLAEATAGRVRGVELIYAAAEELEDPEARALALIRLGRILGIRSRYEASTKVFAAARKALSGTDSKLIWRAEVGEAISGSQHPPTRKRYTERLEYLLTQPDIESFPIGRALLGIGALECIFTARPCEEALRLVERLLTFDPRDIEQDGSAHRMAAMVLALSGQADESDALSSRLEELSRRQGSEMELTALTYPRLLAAIERGEVNALTERAGEALEVSRLGWGIRAPNTVAALAVARIEADDEPGATAALLSMGGEESLRDALMFPVWLEARGFIALSSDDPEAALADFERAGEIREESGFISPALSWLGWRSGAALSHLRLGRPEIASQLAHQELTIAIRSGIPRSIGNAQRSLGLICPGEAGLEHLRSAVATHKRSVSALEEARSLIALGGALRRQNRRRESREPLRKGLDLARRCRAARLARQAEEELQASGARLGGRALSGLSALTPAELRCAELAASGLTNRQIAARLFLSHKTVEHHLGRSYRKLGVASRQDLPAIMDRPTNETSETTNPTLVSPQVPKWDRLSAAE